MNKQKSKQGKGITLIALIITILVLLILAVVAIGALQNTGIITHAQNAKSQYSKAQVEEEVKIALSEWKILRHTQGQDLGEFLNNKYDNVTGPDEEGSYIVTLNGYEVTIAKDGDISEIQNAGPKPVVSNVKIVDSEGNEVPEKSITEEDTTVYIQFNASIEEGTIESVTIEETVLSVTEGIYSYGVIENGEYVFSITGKIGEETYTTKKKITVNQFDFTPKPGDYIAYDCYTGVDTTLLSYEAPSDLTGATDNQTFTLTSEDIKLKWKILDCSGEEILITTEEPISTSLTLKGREGYVTGPEELNKICAIYGHGENANSNKYSYIYNEETVTSGGRSIIVEDVNKICNYTPANPTQIRVYKEADRKYVWFGDRNLWHDATFYYYDHSNKVWKEVNEDGGTTILSDIYSYSFEKNFLTTSSSYYWLASRCVNGDYYCRIVHNSMVHYNRLYSYSGTPSEETNAIRPVVVLKSGLKIDKVNGVWQIEE